MSSSVSFGAIMNGHNLVNEQSVNNLKHTGFRGLKMRINKHTLHTEHEQCCMACSDCVDGEESVVSGLVMCVEEHRHPGQMWEGSKMPLR